MTRENGGEVCCSCSPVRKTVSQLEGIGSFSFETAVERFRLDKLLPFTEITAGMVKKSRRGLAVESGLLAVHPYRGLYCMQLRSNGCIDFQSNAIVLDSVQSRAIRCESIPIRQILRVGRPLDPVRESGRTIARSKIGAGSMLDRVG